MKFSVVFIAMSLWSSMLVAGGLEVMPTRLEVGSGDISSLTVTNRTDKPINIQARAVIWDQNADTGMDHLDDDASDLIWYPKLFTLPPGGSQSIRVGSQQKTEHEKTYRLFVREVAVQDGSESGPGFAVRLSIPVFVKPIGEIIESPLVVSDLVADNGALRASVMNPGNHYSMMHPLKVIGQSGDREQMLNEVRGWYVLAGVKKSFDLSIDAEQCRSWDSLKLVAVTASSESAATFPLNAELCDGLRAPEPAS